MQPIKTIGKQWVWVHEMSEYCLFLWMLNINKAIPSQGLLFFVLTIGSFTYAFDPKGSKYQPEIHFTCQELNKKTPFAQ